jgi:CTP:molybdopterin cytidylyltransferase MocA
VTGRPPVAVPPELRHPDLTAALAVVCAGTPPSPDDAEVRHFAAHERALRDDPRRYLDWLLGLADAGLSEGGSRRLARDLLTRVRDWYRDAGLGGYAAAEVMQVCVADLVMVEELASAGLPAEALAALHDGLLPEALELVARLLRNLAARMRTARRVAVAPADPRVRPLRALLAEAPPPPVLTRDADQPVLVVATAGRGTRLRTTVPKALVPVGGEPMVARVVRAAAGAGIDRCVFVLKHRADVQAGYLARSGAVLVQDRAEGTGHSAAAGLAALAGQRAPVLVTFSDLPFLVPECFARPLAGLATADFVMSTFRAEADDGVGRVRRDRRGAVVGVGQPRLGADVTDEGDGGVYALDRDRVLAALVELRNDNPRYEYGLPDVTARLVARGGRVGTVSGPAEHYLSVNTPSDLVRARLHAAVPPPALLARPDGGADHTAGGTDLSDQVGPLTDLAGRYG